MKLESTILYNFKKSNLRLKQFETVKEVASFFLGIFAIEAKHVGFKEKGEDFWRAREK